MLHAICGLCMLLKILVIVRHCRSVMAPIENFGRTYSMVKDACGERNVCNIFSIRLWIWLLCLLICILFIRHFVVRVKIFYDFKMF